MKRYGGMICLDYKALTDRVRLCVPQALPQIQDLPEFKAIDDEEGRKGAFAKFVKRQKVRRPILHPRNRGC